MAADIFGGAGRYGDEVLAAGGGLFGISRYTDEEVEVAGDAAKTRQK